MALGVPVNLDEVHASSQGGGAAALPPLELHVPGAAPHNAAPSESAASTTSSAPRAQESWGERRRRELGLQLRPVPSERIDALLQLREDDLTLQPLPALQELVKEMHALTAQLGETLQEHLTVRDAFASEAETFHARIRDLVAGASTKLATKAKSEKRGLLSLRRGAGRGSGTPPPKS